MDFMNLNQAAHGDREFAHIEARLGLRPQDRRRPLAGRRRPAADRHLVPRGLRPVRGQAPQAGPLRRQHAQRGRDRGRQGLGPDAVRRRGQRLQRGRPERRRAGRGEQPRSTRWSSEYEASYDVAPSLRAGGADRESLREAARIEIALREFMAAGGFGGDHRYVREPRRPQAAARHRRPAARWPTATASAPKATGRPRSWSGWSRSWPGACRAGRRSWRTTPTTSTRPDQKVLGAHMLEVCPTHLRQEADRARSIRSSIGGRSDPVRLVFDAGTGPGHRRRPDGHGRSVPHRRQRDRPRAAERSRWCKLPVGRAVWKPRPNLATATESWLMAGGSHHTVLTRAVGRGGHRRLRRDGRGASSC